jgi:hypothetical protein
MGTAYSSPFPPPCPTCGSERVSLTREQMAGIRVGRLPPRWGHYCVGCRVATLSPPPLPGPAPRPPLLPVRPSYLENRAARRRAAALRRAAA